MRKKISSRIGFTLVIIGCALVPVLVVGGLNSAAHFAKLEESAQDQLRQIAESRNGYVNDFLSGMRQSAEWLAASAEVVALADFWNAEAEAPESVSSAADAVVRTVQESRWGSSHHIFVTDANGRVRFSPFHGSPVSTHRGQNIADNRYFNQAREGSLITDFHAFEEKDHNHQLALAPIRSKEGEFLGLVAIEITVGYVKKILNDGLQIGESGRLFLSTLDGREVTHLKEEKRGTLHPEGVKRALAEGLAVDVFEYDGNAVIGCYLKDPQWDWILSAELDKTEALAPVYAAMRNDARNVAILFVGAAFGLYFVAQRILNFFVVKPLIGTFNEVQQRISMLKHHVQLLSSNGNQLSESSNTQVASLARLAEVIGDLNDRTKQNNASATELADIVSAARSTSEEGRRETAQMLESIAALAASSQEISEIIKTIDEISFQTNILALNAAVEAARAGEAGAGFAVVADEVRSLSQRSASAAQETSTKINASLENMNQGERSSQQVGRRLDEILEGVANVDAFAGKIAQATSDQEKGIDEVNQSVKELELIAGGNALSAEETASSCDEIHREAASLGEQLSGLLQQFGYSVPPSDTPDIPEPQSSVPTREGSVELFAEPIGVSETGVANGSAEPELKEHSNRRFQRQSDVTLF